MNRSLALSVSIAIGLFAIPYLVLWSFVGKFPAESLLVSAPQEPALVVGCFNPNDRTREIQIRPDTRAAIVAQLRSPLSTAETASIDNSRALYGSLDGRMLVGMDFPDSQDIAFLDQLVANEKLSRTKATRILSSMQRFSKPCNVARTDHGTTELFWATVGTVVLHHWAYLYDATVFDGRPIHAQYGYAVPLLATALAHIMPQGGPTTFVRAAWFVFFLIGCAYILCFGFIFRRHPSIVVLAMAFQIYVFISLYPFAILLAPGYHWTRELVLLWPALAFHASKFRNRIILLGGALLLDPTFFILSLAAAAIALITINTANILRYLRSNSRVAIGAGAALVVLLGAIAYLDRSNLSYVVSKLGIVNVSAIGWSNGSIIVLNAALAILQIGLAARGRARFEASYFSLIGLAAVTFYLITPDEFHFKKYIAYLVPMYTVFACMIADIALKDESAETRAARDVVAAGALVFACAGFIGLMAAPDGYHLRIWDSSGQAYFQASNNSINGRTIDANLNESTLAQLKAFPSRARFDYIVSPLDKYLLFLYDVHNGFDSVDYLAWLDSASKAQTTLKQVLARHAQVIVDSSLLSVNLRATIDSSNSIFGPFNQQAALHMKNRLRAHEIATALASQCRTVARSATWLEMQC